MTNDAVSRLAPLPAADWSEEERAILRGNLARADRYLSGDPDGPPVPPIIGLLARHPRVGGAWLSFSGALIEHGSLAERERELLILRVGHRTRSRYLWSQHLAMGTEAGLDPHDLQALRDGTVTDRWHGRDRHLLMVADELVDDHTVSDATWSGLRDYLDEQQVLEVLFLVGSYVCLAMVLNSVGLDPQLKE